MTRNKCTPCFPGDPRFCGVPGKEGMLSTRLHDCLLQRAGPPQELGSSRDFFMCAVLREGNT